MQLSMSRSVINAKNMPSELSNPIQLCRLKKGRDQDVFGFGFGVMVTVKVVLKEGKC